MACAACAPRASTPAFVDSAPVHAAAPATLSAQPSADSYADLAPLGAAIGDARVVALGEPLHAVGNIDAYGARLVSYLHDRLGFTVLAWEAGLWSCEDDAASCLGYPWGRIRESRGLRDVPRALGMKVTGFDVQFSGPGAEGARHHLRDALLKSLGNGREELAARVTAAFERLPKAKRFRKMTATERDVDRSTFREALAALQTHPRTREGDLLVRAVQNVVTLYDWHEDVHADVSIDMDWNHHTELNNKRDEGMADNVLWILRDRYPNEKIVLWAANMHIARNVSAVTDLRGPEYATAMSRYDTMGTVLSKALGTSYFALGMSAYAGNVGNPPDDAVRPIAPPQTDSIESQYRPAAGGTRFVRLDPASETRSRARFFGLTDFLAPWSQLFDAALVFDTVTPATPEIPPPAPAATPDAGR